MHMTVRNAGYADDEQTDTQSDRTDLRKGQTCNGIAVHQGYQRVVCRDAPPLSSPSVVAVLLSSTLDADAAANDCLIEASTIRCCMVVCLRLTPAATTSYTRQVLAALSHVRTRPPALTCIVQRNLRGSELCRIRVDGIAHLSRGHESTKSCLSRRVDGTVARIHQHNHAYAACQCSCLYHLIRPRLSCLSRQCMIEHQ